MLKKFLIAGALVWVPIIATIWIIQLLVNLFDQLFALLPHELQPDVLFGAHIPGLGIVLAVIVVLLTGLLVTNILGNKIVQWTDSFLKHIPFVGSLYSTIKQMLQTIMSSDGKSFRKVLLIEYPRKGLWSIGFQTSAASSQVNETAGEEMLTVFIPTTPNPTSGFLIMVPTKETKELNMSVDTAFKVIVSLGTLSAEEAKKIT